MNIVLLTSQKKNRMLKMGFQMYCFSHSSSRENKIKLDLITIHDELSVKCDVYLAHNNYLCCEE